MNPQVLIVIGSKSDHEIMNECVLLLKDFDIDVEYTVASAHRAPQKVSDLASHAEERGIKVIIAGAGGAAHLPGVIAAQTSLPVIGVPMPTSHLNGIDSLLSIVQMPAGIPVATVALGKAGAKNAALLAIQIMALNDQKLANKLKTFRKEQTEKSLNVKLSD